MTTFLICVVFFHGATPTTLGVMASPPTKIEPAQEVENSTAEKTRESSRENRNDESTKPKTLFDVVYSKKTPPGPPPIIDLLDVKDADLIDVLRFLCEKGQAQLVVDPSVGHIKVTCRLEHISWLHAANLIIKNAGLAAQFEAGVLKTGN